MGEIKHTARFAEIERIFGDYFNSHLAPVMRDTQNYLNRRQAEEMAAYSTSAAGILGSMAAAGNPMMDPYQTLKVTGEWNSKTTEDYLEMCKEKLQTIRRYSQTSHCWQTSGAQPWWMKSAGKDMMNCPNN